MDVYTWNIQPLTSSQTLYFMYPTCTHELSNITDIACHIVRSVTLSNIYFINQTIKENRYVIGYVYLWVPLIPQLSFVVGYIPLKAYSDWVRNICIYVHFSPTGNYCTGLVNIHQHCTFYSLLLHHQTRKILVFWCGGGDHSAKNTIRMHHQTLTLGWHTPEKYP